MDRLEHLLHHLSPSPTASPSSAKPSSSPPSSPYSQSAKRFPAGPLDHYRHKASFDWKKLELSWDGEDLVEFKNRVWSTLEKDPLFRQPILELEVLYFYTYLFN